MAKKIKKQELEELQGVIGKLNQIKLRTKYTASAKAPTTTSSSYN